MPNLHSQVNRVVFHRAAVQNPQKFEVSRRNLLIHCDPDLAGRRLSGVEEEHL